jgi:7,8-dihydropterin-6-yl-methyl-4-(beta-D-ribofuranosyl)aminobenzene 5'-phosphate synthase
MKGRRAVVVALVFAVTALSQERRQVKTARVTVLSTMLASEGIGEWGFAALVEVDGRRILFDTGARPRTVLENARELKLDLATITDVILSHNHGDHTGGLVTLRRELSKTNPAALFHAHAGKGISLKRGGANPMLATRADYEATGARITEYAEPHEILPGAWLTGPVPRVYPERNWGGFGAGTATEDTIPEDSSLVLDTPRGLVLISGCGHAGIINTIEYARKVVRPAPVYMALGGFHLFQASESTLEWTAKKLREFGLAGLLGAHCTGIEATYRLRALTGLDRQHAAVAAVGAVFTLDGAPNPGLIAR